MSVLDSIKSVFVKTDSTMTLSVIPGESAIVAIANLIQALAEGQTPDEKAKLWERYLELSEPWHAIAVAISADAAGFVKNILHLNPPSK